MPFPCFPHICIHLIFLIWLKRFHVEDADDYPNSLYGCPLFHTFHSYLTGGAYNYTARAFHLDENHRLRCTQSFPRVMFSLTEGEFWVPGEAFVKRVGKEAPTCSLAVVDNGAGYVYFGQLFVHHACVSMNFEKGLVGFARTNRV